MQLQNYIAGQWIAGTGKLAELHDASTGEPACRQAGSSQQLPPAALPTGRPARLHPLAQILSE